MFPISNTMTLPWVSNFMFSGLRQVEIRVAVPYLFLVLLDELIKLQLKGISSYIAFLEIENIWFVDLKEFFNLYLLVIFKTCLAPNIHVGNCNYILLTID